MQAEDCRCGEEAETSLRVGQFTEQPCAQTEVPKLQPFSPSLSCCEPFPIGRADKVSSNLAVLRTGSIALETSFAISAQPLRPDCHNESTKLAQSIPAAQLLQPAQSYLMRKAFPCNNLRLTGKGERLMGPRRAVNNIDQGIQRIVNESEHSGFAMVRRTP